MARPKKIVFSKELETVATEESVVPTLIALLSVDYPSEGLNNMAKKINELVEIENARILGEQA